ncbi:MAG: hypothetical protein ACXWWC_06650 [Chitinophagaceae bacterium]
MNHGGFIELAEDYHFQFHAQHPADKIMMMNTYASCGRWRSFACFLLCCARSRDDPAQDTGHLFFQ